MSTHDESRLSYLYPTAGSLECHAASHVGYVRKRNEDFHVCDADRGIFVVADGIGGHKRGDIASSLAASKAYAQLRENRVDPRGACLAAHDAVLRAAALEPEQLGGMGTTLVVAQFDGRGQARVAHVGDSRAYHWSPTRGGLRRLTQDHAVGNCLKQAVGGTRRPVPDVTHAPMVPGDILLLCTDGLTKVVDDPTLILMLGALNSAPCGDITTAMVQTALGHGGPDNVTVCVVRRV